MLCTEHIWLVDEVNIELPSPDQGEQKIVVQFRCARCRVFKSNEVRIVELKPGNSS